MPRALRQDEVIDLIVALMAATALFGWHAGFATRSSTERMRVDPSRRRLEAMARLSLYSPCSPSRSGREGSPPAGTWLLGWAALASTMVWTWAGAVTSRPMRRTSAAIIGGGIVMVVALRAGMHAQSLWHALQEPTLWMVFTLLRLSRVGSGRRSHRGRRRHAPVQRHGLRALRGARGHRLDFGSSRSRSSGSIATSTAFRQALLLWPLGMVAVWLLDVVRIVLLIRLGEWRGELAVTGFHSFAGWVAVSAVAFSLAVAGRRASLLPPGASRRRFSGPIPRRRTCSRCWRSPRRRWSRKAPTMLGHAISSTSDHRGRRALVVSTADRKSGVGGQRRGRLHRYRSGGVVDRLDASRGRDPPRGSWRPPRRRSCSLFTGMGRVLVARSHPGCGLCGTASRGARVSRLPPAQARFARFRESADASYLLVRAGRDVYRIRRAPPAMAGRHRRRSSLRRCALPSRPALRRRRRPWHEQRSNRRLRPRDRTLADIELRRERYARMPTRRGPLIPSPVLSLRRNDRSARSKDRAGASVTRNSQPLRNLTAARPSTFEGSPIATVSVEPESPTGRIACWRAIASGTSCSTSVVGSTVARSMSRQAILAVEARRRGRLRRSLPRLTRINASRPPCSRWCADGDRELLRVDEAVADESSLRAWRSPGGARPGESGPVPARLDYLAPRSSSRRSAAGGSRASSSARDSS